MVITAPSVDRESLLDHYRRVRAATEALAAPLSDEDQCAQSMPDASPSKWHRAHTTWFFETFVLAPFVDGYRAHDPQYSYLFNSYYEAIGERHARPERGMLTRPSSPQVGVYRRAVDDAMETLIAERGRAIAGTIEDRIVLGLHHEQQHQELLLMDVKHAFSRNGYDPAYRHGRHTATPHAAGSAEPLRWVEHGGGMVEIGHSGGGFAFDNEGPAHIALLPPFAVADRLVTCGEWKAFIADGGYERPELWLSDGWHTARHEGWDAPLYWERDGANDDWTLLSLDGRRAVRDDEPVVHVSHYEADAYAHWTGYRLPTEQEWETIAVLQPIGGNLLDGESLATAPLHPTPASAPNSRGVEMQQCFGDVWEWTGSAYLPYPRFRAAEGAIGEYNGKFMSNQIVLRGGACVTPRDHVRPSYRNFFYPHQRWMFAGVRLARDLDFDANS
jgi:ergothioneine biosynthesis protein EgtB